MVKMIKGISLFSNVGIGETYFKNHNVEIVAANELVEKRADFYSSIYPNVKMIVGDFRNKDIFNNLLKEYEKNECNFLIATPPCQGMSLAGKRDKNDERNLLIIDVINFIKKVQPDNILIENVPQLLETHISIMGG